MTSSSCGLSSSLSTFATRFWPTERSLLALSTSTRALIWSSTIFTAVSGIFDMVSMRLMISPRADFSSVKSTFAAACGASFDSILILKSRTVARSRSASPCRTST